MANAAAGAVVCLSPTTYSRIDLSNINKTNYVTLRGAANRSTTVGGVVLNGASYLRIEGLKITNTVDFYAGLAQHHFQIVGNEITPGSNPGIHGRGINDILIERNYIHDVLGGFDGMVVGDQATNVTIRYNRLERVDEDYLQTNTPYNLVIDHNWFGPGLSPTRRPGAHFDVWQNYGTRGADWTFTNNVMRDANQTLGFILGDHGSNLQGFSNIRMVNNLFIRSASAETCQFSPTNGFVFEQNTLVDARGCRWGSGDGDDWPDAQNYSIKRNILSGNSSFGCNNTSIVNSCNAFNLGLAANVLNFTSWAETTYYTPNGQPSNVGARLSSADFPGWPFE